MADMNLVHCRMLTHQRQLQREMREDALLSTIAICATRLIKRGRKTDAWDAEFRRDVGAGAGRQHQQQWIAAPSPACESLWLEPGAGVFWWPARRSQNWKLSLALRRPGSIFYPSALVMPQADVLLRPSIQSPTLAFDDAEEFIAQPT